MIEAPVDWSVDYLPPRQEGARRIPPHFEAVGPEPLAIGCQHIHRTRWDAYRCGLHSFRSGGEWMRRIPR